ELPRYTESVVFDLLSLGVTPIIAHPERNRDLARHPKLLQDLIERGCLAQVSTGSVRGRFGPEARRAAEAFLARGLVHLLGTDAHGPDRRRMIMAEARDLVAARHGTEFARALTADNPLAVLEGRDCRPAAELDGGRQGRRTIAGAIFR
ncbi:MAG: CpsB/CapC family capsule biosynthesis tyrosine phosphatase, partial [Bacteroidota bacterium]